MKKTTMKIGLMALALTLSGSMLNAQQADIATAYTLDSWGRETQDLSKLPKMEKDIIILQNVLSDLFSPNNNERFFSSRSAKGMHVPGNGVIFSIGANNLYGDLMVEYVVQGQGISDEKEEKEQDIDQLNKETEDKLRAKSQEFLANYGSLLSELKSGEKLMLNIDYSVRQKRDNDRSSNGRVAFVTSRSSIKKRMQSSISYKTLNDFTTGKINLNQAMGAIEISIIDDAEKDMTDAKILAGILDDLMQSSLDGKFKRRSRTSWTYFDGFGLMFNIQMGTQVGNGVVVFSQGGSGSRVISRSETDKEREEQLKEIEEAYPQFEEMLKENIIQYGRTLRSLGAGESVIVNVDLGTSSRDSKIPRSIRMIVPKSSIDAYAKGQKTLDQVKKEIDIKQLQSSIGGNSTFIYGGADSFFPAVYETVPEPPTPAKVSGTAVRAKSNR